MPKPAPKISDDEFVKRQLEQIDLAVRETKPIEAKVVDQSTSRTDSVNSLLSGAIARASQLVLSEVESKELAADFSDDCFYRGAGGNQELLYLNHSALRNRLNKVIGLGRWSLIIRRSWQEEFTTSKREPAVRIYVEAVLIVRGCYVGESIGDMVYYKNNSSQNYGDAYEGAKSSALRRCCKDFGIGLQPWDKDFCEQWKAKYPGHERPVKK